MKTTTIQHPLFDIPGDSRLLIVGLLGTFALFVMAWIYPTFPGDEEAIVRLQALRTGWLDNAALAFANMGLIWVFVPVTVVLIACLMLAERYADMAMVVAGGLFLGVGNVLKYVVDRPRPDYQLIVIDSNLSFPSGHTLLAVIFGGVLIYLIGLWVKPVLLRRSIQVTIFAAVIMMGASRVYLGVHWPSDVIGAYVLGAMALIGLIGLRNAVASAR